MSQERIVAELSNLAAYQQFIRDNPVVILKASATWCGPCQTIKPYFAEKVNELPTGVSVLLIDISKSPSISRKLSIRSVPCFITIINGQPCDVMTGANKGNLDKFFEKLKKRLGM